MNETLNSGRTGHKNRRLSRSDSVKYRKMIRSEADAGDPQAALGCLLFDKLDDLTRDMRTVAERLSDPEVS